MDATVFCSSFGNEKLQGRWDRIMQSELTVFRYFKRGAMAPVGLSNWFIAAVPHHIVISSVLDMLLVYWKDYNCLVDYYIFHLFLVCLSVSFRWLRLGCLVRIVITVFSWVMPWGVLSIKSNGRI